MGFATVETRPSALRAAASNIAQDVEDERAKDERDFASLVLAPQIVKQPVFMENCPENGLKLSVDKQSQISFNESFAGGRLRAAERR